MKKTPADGWMNIAGGAAIILFATEFAYPQAAALPGWGSVVYLGFSAWTVMFGIAFLWHGQKLLSSSPKTNLDENDS